MNVLYPALSADPALYPSLSICSRNSKKCQPWSIFARVCKAKYSAGWNHDDSLEDDHGVLTHQVEISPPHFTTSFILFAEASRYPRRKFRFGDKLGKHTFLWIFLKQIFLMVGRHKQILSKKILSYSLVDILSLHAFLL